ncbi:MAG: HDIG domain-containing protein [Kiritimatiellae bacterium]|nr:HDIG domain-containing protein [Kiritimatiellia bacterium]
MNTTISKSRSKKSRQRDKEDSRHKKTIRVLSLKNGLMAVLFWLTSLSVLHLGGRLQYSALLPGQQAPSTVVSSADFSCTDLARTAIEQQQAAGMVPPVFKLNTAALNTATRLLNKLFQTLSTVLASYTPEAPPAERLRQEAILDDMLNLLNIQLTAAILLDTVTTENLANLPQTADEVLNRLSSTPMLSAEEKETRFRGLAANGLITLANRKDELSEPLSVKSIDLPEEALDRILLTLGEQQKIDRATRRMMARLIQPWIAPNLLFDPVMTDKLREQARQKVQPVVINIKAGETLVQTGERITPAIQEKLRAYERRLQQMETNHDKLLKTLGDAMLLFMALIICGGILRITHPKALNDDSALVIMLLLSLLSIVPLKGLLYLSNSMDWLNQSLLMYLFPVGLTTLLATILLGSYAALAAGVWSVCTAAIMLGYNFNVFLLGLFVAMITARASRNIHRRSRVFQVGLLAGFGEILFALALFVLTLPSWQVLLQQALAGLFSGLLCAFLALLLIPLFEASFDITTDITLLELSDMGNPLLQRLAMEAPGTYHHSLMVANLGSAAALEIGANALAVRVGAYFHDIGKLTKPEFFIENSQHRANPHDDLSPNMSTLVITSHVKEGLTLANRHKLPRIIKEAIQQHHGTSLVSYFYHRACKQQENEASQEGSGRGTARLNEEDFRYPGPTPTPPALAILALADSTEAASRSIEKTSSSRIESLVNEIIDRKLHDGQLETSELTLMQLSTIKRSFIFSLTSMLHGRIAYPKHENGSKKPTK